MLFHCIELGCTGNKIKNNKLNNIKQVTKKWLMFTKKYSPSQLSFKLEHLYYFVNEK